MNIHLDFVLGMLFWGEKRTILQHIRAINAQISFFIFFFIVMARLELTAVVMVHGSILQHNNSPFFFFCSIKMQVSMSAKS